MLLVALDGGELGVESANEEAWGLLLLPIRDKIVAAKADHMYAKVTILKICTAA